MIDEYVLKGNTGILKCLVPSFVSDFVQIVSWVADDGTTYDYETSRNFNSGKFSLLFMMQEFTETKTFRFDMNKSLLAKTNIVQQ